MRLNVYAVLTALLLCTTANAAPVELVKAHSVTAPGGRYGQGPNQLFNFSIKVDNLALHKKVSIHYADADGQWRSMPATFSQAISGQQELWQGGWTRSLEGGSIAPLNLQFAIKYEVNGSTYWDNNGGRNYRLAASSGELLTRPVLLDHALAVAPHSGADGSSKPGFFQGGVLLQNLGYAKEVKIHYSLNNWATVKLINANFTEARLLQGQMVSYPNSNGVEYWQFHSEGAALQQATASQIVFAVSYKVNGVTYWDNNFGQNYRVTITRY